MKLYANLHTHSTHSDGVYSPTEMVRVAKNEGYRAIALADHDTATGYPELKAECEKNGMETIFATEFSVPQGYHIVGMSFDPEYPEMKEYLAGMSQRETNQTQVLFERGVKNGFIKGITWDEVLEANATITWLCNEHVFRAMKLKGVAVDTDYESFFDNVYGVHRGEVPPCYAFKETKDMIRLINDAGGIAIIAHPHKQLDDVKTLMGYGLRGIEVWHGDLTDEEQVRALEIARDNKLFISGGSDHSGLCGGQYDRYEHPEESEFYALPCSLGTTEFFFRELKAGKLFEGRENVIDTAIELMTK